MPLNPATDFEQYRSACCRRFVAMARAKGQHSFHDLDELAQDFYAQFWTDWLERPKEEFDGLPVPYIAGAMLNKMRDLSRRGRSVRSPELVQVESEQILATVASEDMSPDEQLVLQEEMWLVNEVIHSLPPRLQVVFKAVFSRDTKKKDSPLSGYKLAAQQLGVSEARAKKLSLEANKRIRLAIERIEAGRWCDRWEESIALVAGGGEGTPEFLAHADHCVMCRLGVAHLRRQAAIMPLPLLTLVEHVGVLGRFSHHARTVYIDARQQLTFLFGRHASPASEAASGIVGGSGAAGVAGAGIFKVGALCLAGAVVAGGAASVCLKTLGVPVPIVNAISHTHVHVRAKPHLREVASGQGVIAAVTVSSPITTPAVPDHHAPTEHHQQSTPSQTAREAQKEFNPGGGSGASIDQSSSPAATTARVGSSTSSRLAEPQSQPHHNTRISGGAVQSGESNEFGP
jgi:RNA polymerase sigma factor (sigma-70 family)